jgi:hypothetical protein
MLFFVALPAVGGVYLLVCPAFLWFPVGPFGERSDGDGYRWAISDCVAPQSKPVLFPGPVTGEV